MQDLLGLQWLHGWGSISNIIPSRPAAGARAADEALDETRASEDAARGSLLLPPLLELERSWPPFPPGYPRRAGWHCRTASTSWAPDTQPVRQKLADRREMPRMRWVFRRSPTVAHTSRRRLFS